MVTMKNTSINAGQYPGAFKPQFLFLYDGTFEGLLSTIFEIYERKAEPFRIEKMAKNQPFMFGRCVSVNTNKETADRVCAGVVNKTSKGALHSLYTAFLSQVQGIEMLIYRWVKQAMDSQRNIEGDYTNSLVLEIKQINKQVARELNKAIAFTQFKSTEIGVGFATISSAFNVMPLVAEHFLQALPTENWLLFDAEKMVGIYSNQGKVSEVEVSLTTEEGQLMLNLSDQGTEEMKLVEVLKQGYFNANGNALPNSVRINVALKPMSILSSGKENKPTMLSNSINPVSWTTLVNKSSEVRRAA